MKLAGAGTAGRLERVLTAVPWLVLVTGPVWANLVSHYSPAHLQLTLTVVLSVFFAAMLVRILLVARRRPAARPALLSLFAGVALWAAASAMINGSGSPALTHFPAPGEWLFLLSYAGLAAFVLLHRRRRLDAQVSTWLDTVVICGGAACVAGIVLLAPVADRLGRNGPDLLLALLYPLLDVTLLVIVLAQTLLTGRFETRRVAALLLGFAALAYADSSFLLHVASGRYDFSFPCIEAWGLGFTLLTAAACRPEANVRSRRHGEELSPLVLGAGAAAAVVLAFEPVGTVRSCLVVPALVTLVAGGVRLALALRTVRRSVDAVRLARSDDLTDLPNRRALVALVEERRRAGQPTGLAVLDLDGFKDINDTLGHSAGDRVLVELAGRLRAAVDRDIVLARLGGDEFALVTPFDDELRLLETAANVLAAVREPLRVDGISLRLDASIGCSVLEVRDTGSSELLRRADVAMYDAKRKRVGALLYDVDSDTFSRERLKLAEELRRAIDEGQLVLWYQPQLEAATGRLFGLEALVRWAHPGRGLLLPMEFLPVARRAGLMQALSNEVARLAVADVLAWRATGLRVRVALNCAPPELMTGLFVDQLSTLVDAHGVCAEDFTVEVTEDSFISEPYRARLALQDVRRKGYEIAVDDYGTGFSSLSYLRDLPIQELKIDRTFVAAMTTDERSRMIVASTVQLARGLSLRTVAEGVEDAATAADLVALGVDVLQGYHLSEPVPAAAVPAYARRLRSVIS